MNKKSDISYKDAGVDIEKGDLFVERIKKKVLSTYNDRVYQGVGGFASLYEKGDSYLAAGTDGVGTKLKFAIDVNKHDTIGIDLVAMCVNDILCVGAKSSFFMDYFASSHLDLSVSEDVIDGIVDGCKQSQAVLIGGETAEMPGMYSLGDYDLAGFVVGEVLKENLIDGTTLKEGDQIFGLPSSGFHSNGFSLIRQLVQEDELELKTALLAPTRIYHKTVMELLKYDGLVKGMAHITGGGLKNIPRINKKFNYNITNLPQTTELPSFVQTILERSSLLSKQLYETFNMGIGFVLITDRPDELSQKLETLNERFYLMGSVSKGDALVCFDTDEIKMTL
ncbi:MAG: phosphoribosylformylglycinamidine cyclo-ligase [Bacteriovoracaceae bacterium]|jgi:phosphoribosylformylglycinamidine cyclo-ligase|nr:phosphoribosylformylglycinamidine cyclo-ligase [Bacteriovoracaceae bacterium]